MPNELPHAIDDGRFNKHQEDVYISTYNAVDGKPGMNPYAVAYSAAEHAKRIRMKNLQNAIKQIDINEALLILSGFKKTLLSAEQEGRIAEQDLEDMRYIQSANSPQQGYEFAPRIIRAQKKLLDAVKLISEANLLVESARMDIVGEPAVEAAKYRRRTGGR